MSTLQIQHLHEPFLENVREAAGCFGVWNFQPELRPAKIPPFQCVWTAANDSGNTSAVYIQDWSQLWLSNKQNHAGKKSKIFQLNELFPKYGESFPFAQEFNQRENCDDEEQVFVAALVHAQWRVVWLNFTSTRNLQIFNLTTSSFRASPWIHWFWDYYGQMSQCNSVIVEWWWDALQQEQQGWEQRNKAWMDYKNWISDCQYSGAAISPSGHLR